MSEEEPSGGGSAPQGAASRFRRGADRGRGRGRADRKIIARFPVYGLKKILVRAVAMEFYD